MLLKLSRSVNAEYVEEGGLSWNYYGEAEVIHVKCERGWLVTHLKFELSTS
jgi:hypothetical protein